MHFLQNPTSHGIPSSRLSLSLLVDCENIPAKLVRDILKIANVLGDCSTRQFYANFRSRYCATGNLKQPISILKVANSADISLTVGSMDLVHSGEYDGFVIASSDLDFTSLVQRLRKGGKFVAGIGNSFTHRSLRNACDMFIGTGNWERIANERQIVREAVPILKEAMAGTKG